MKYLKTFESFNIVNEEELFKSDVYKFLSDKERKEKVMEIGLPKYIKDALRFKKYKNSSTEKNIDLSDLTEQDYKDAFDLGEKNEWKNPFPLLGGSPKFLKDIDPKLKKAYEYIYDRIDGSDSGGGNIQPGGKQG